MLLPTFSRNLKHCICRWRRARKADSASHKEEAAGGMEGGGSALPSTETKKNPRDSLFALEIPTANASAGLAGYMVDPGRSGRFDTRIGKRSFPMSRLYMSEINIRQLWERLSRVREKRRREKIGQNQPRAEPGRRRRLWNWGRDSLRGKIGLGGGIPLGQKRADKDKKEP